MTFDELLEKVRGLAAKADVSEQDFLAVQVNITGKNPGVFYVEVKYRDEGFKEQSLKLTGFPAQIVQHEMDHLEGIII